MSVCVKENKRMTISQLIAIKGGTMEELCQYAQMKGITLPNNPDYSLSSSELNALDSQLAFKMKYGRIVSVSKDGQNDSPAEKPVVTPSEAQENSNPPKLNVLGKIDLSKLNQSSRSKNKKNNNNNNKGNDDEKNQKKSNRIIGIIKFFDSNKGWGFVVSGNKGISGKAEDEDRIFSLHLTNSEWKGSSSPKDKDWVILTPRMTKRGWSACDVEQIEYNRDTLLFAMKYRGKNAKIYGYDNKGEHFDENVLCHIIKKMVVSLTPYRHKVMTYETTKFTEIIDCFCEYIENMSEERQSSTVSQFLEDTNLNNLLFKIFTEGEYSSEDLLRQNALQLYSRMLLEHIFESGTMSDLSELPATFDFTPYIDKLTQLLVNEAQSDSTVTVEKWLGEHNIYDKLKLDSFDTNTIPLRLILKELSGDNSWIDELCTDWSDIRDFIKKNNVHAYSYCKHFFLNKDEDFVKNHTLTDILDEDTINLGKDMS